MTLELDDRLLHPYRAVRRVVAGAEAPWSGVIVRLESGESGVLVDETDIGAEWSGWSASPDGHVFSALDVVRRDGGHAVLTPLCTLRLVDYLDRRRARGHALTDGETVTLIVSVVRGLTEIAGADVDVGEWWLTDAGRPVLVTESGTAPVAEATSHAMRGVLAATLFPSAWAWIDEWPASPRELAGFEARAFGLATPAPLADVGVSLAETDSPQRYGAEPARAESVVEEDRPPSLAQRLARHVDADAADLFSRTTTAVWRRFRKPTEGSRRGVWLLAGGAAVVVIVGGALWPSSEGVTEATPVATASASSPAPAAPVDQSVATGDPDDLTTVAADLLTARTGCAGDLACLGSVVVDTTSTFPAGVIDNAPADRRATLIDDYGGVAVVRVESVTSAEPSQLVVVQKQEAEGWLLRDVYAAQQP